MWVKSPELTKVFELFSDAYDVSLKCSGSVVVGIFESASQVWVAVIQQ
jgi:hypothetical protein